MVASPIQACQCSTGNWLVTRLARLPARSSMSSSRSEPTGPPPATGSGRYPAAVAFRITPLAAARIAERLIPADWLDDVLHRPQRSLPADQGRVERQSVFERDGRPVLLRVICQDDLVIIALLTRKLEKYGSSR